MEEIEISDDDISSTQQKEPDRFLELCKELTKDPNHKENLAVSIFYCLCQWKF